MAGHAPRQPERPYVVAHVAVSVDGATTGLEPDVGRFYELAAAGPAPIASEALERNAGLYAIENGIRGRSAEERRAVRLERSRLIIDDLEPWLRTKLALISQKSKLLTAPGLPEAPTLERVEP